MTDENKELTTNQAPAELPVITSPGDIYFNLQLFEHVQRVARMFASSSMVPERYKNNVGDCTIALSMAQRLKADPIMVMQNTYVVHGSPGMEGKMVIALINQSGKFTQLLFREEKNPAGEVVECTAYCCLKDTGEEISSSLTWDEVLGHGWQKNKKWSSMRTQMFRYRAATFLARTFCPEVLFGMQTIEELHDVIDITPDAGDKLNEMIGKNNAGKSPTTVILKDVGVIEEIQDRPETLTTKGIVASDANLEEKTEEIQESSSNDIDGDGTQDNPLDFVDGIVKTSDDTTHPFNRSMWINCRAASTLEKLVNDHADHWNTTTDETKQEFFDKWKRILKNQAMELWPFESMEAPTQEDDTHDETDHNCIPAKIYIEHFKSCKDLAEVKDYFLANNTDILNHPEKEAIIAEYDKLLDANQEPKPLVTAQDFINHIYHAEDTSALSMIGMKYAETVDALPEKDDIWNRIDERMAELNGK